MLLAHLAAPAAQAAAFGGLRTRLLAVLEMVKMVGAPEGLATISAPETTKAPASVIIF
jgi:hypothetical protein